MFLALLAYPFLLWECGSEHLCTWSLNSTSGMWYEDVWNLRWIWGHPELLTVLATWQLENGFTVYSSWCAAVNIFFLLLFRLEISLLTSEDCQKLLFFFFKWLFGSRICINIHRNLLLCLFCYKLPQVDHKTFNAKTLGSASKLLIQRLCTLSYSKQQFTCGDCPQM